MILGDGSISKFQVYIYTNALVDREYAEYVIKLFNSLFGIEVKQQKIRKNTISLAISSREIVEYFNKMGLKTGDKIKNDVSIPEWIA
ncbi:MAG: hypothetical protein COZ72_07655, partial [Elusimicrobia bacterium CG_4_8_14_3_um_filter_50_9]